MGKWKGMLRLGILGLMLFWALGMSFRPAKIAVEDQDDDGSSSHWEGVAMARLEAL